jgi:hypothetical protein
MCVKEKTKKESGTGVFTSNQRALAAARVLSKALSTHVRALCATITSTRQANNAAGAVQRLATALGWSEFPKPR